MIKNKWFVCMIALIMLSIFLFACSSSQTKEKTEDIKPKEKIVKKKIEEDESQKEENKRYEVIQTKIEQRAGFKEGEMKFVASVLLQDKADLIDSAKKIKEQFKDKLKDPGVVQVFFFTDEEVAKKYINMSIEESMDYDKYVVGTYIYEKDGANKQSTLYEKDREGTLKVLKEKF